MFIPKRMCIVCRQMKEKDELVRIVKNSASEIFVDKTFKAQGRGAYICKDASCREKLVKTRALDRAFRCTVSSQCLENIMKELI